jgi:hypothetical protein
MKNSRIKQFFKYMYDNLIANFIGFIIGMTATKLVAHFFVTRGIRNLWGLAAKKTVLNKTTYSNLELLIAVVIGFLVFEVFSKWIKKQLDACYPVVKNSALSRYSFFVNKPTS